MGLKRDGLEEPLNLSCPISSAVDKVKKGVRKTKRKHKKLRKPTKKRRPTKKRKLRTTRGLRKRRPTKKVENKSKT